MRVVDHDGDGGRRARSWRESPFFWLLVVLSVLTLLVGAWSWLENRRTLARQSRPAVSSGIPLAADFRLPMSDGRELALSDLAGQVILLNFWATWCPPCKAEMPDLDALYREHGMARQFVVVGVNVEEGRETVAAFARETGISFPLVLDLDGRVTTSAYRVRTLPTSVIVGRDGSVRDIWTGQISRQAMLARLERVWQGAR